MRETITCQPDTTSNCDRRGLRNLINFLAGIAFDDDDPQIPYPEHPLFNHSCYGRSLMIKNTWHTDIELKDILITPSVPKGVPGEEGGDIRFAPRVQI
jgi:hypothetical protein